MSDVFIEKATVDDIASLCELLAILFSQEAEFTVNRDVQAAGLRAIVTNPAVGIILTARKNSQLIGMVNVLFSVSTALGGQVAILEDMVVLPDERGRGIGSRLLNAAITAAYANDCKRMTCLTDNSNEIAHRFYEKQGFVQSQMRPFRLALR